LWFVIEAEEVAEEEVLNQTGHSDEWCFSDQKEDDKEEKKEEEDERKLNRKSASTSSDSSCRSSYRQSADRQALSRDESG
jgi:hypothetical protein